MDDFLNSIMKKYHQLLLLAVSVTSLTLFLVYRHEYNRLHYVLEVFNFFGQPCNFSELQKTDILFSEKDWGAEPTWQEIEDGYVYSAFINSKTEIKAIALQNEGNNIPRNCYLWFEEKKKAVPAKFKFSKISYDEHTGVTAYFYFCYMSIIDSVPYAVSFSLKSRKDGDMKKILLTNSLEHAFSVNTTICVSPSVYSKRRFIEFISFHKLIGIDSFIFYNKDIPHRLTKLMRNISSRLSLNTAFLSWNYPKLETSLTRLIVENDCIMRTFGQSKYVITLEINEFLVPNKQTNFLDMLRDFPDDFHRLSLAVQRFCVSNINTDKPIALQNLEVYNDYNFNVVRYLRRNVKSDNVVSTNVVDKSDASVHKYVKCTADFPKTTTVDTMIKYSTDLIRSPLVQLYIHDQI